MSLLRGLYRASTLFCGLFLVLTSLAALIFAALSILDRAIPFITR